MEQLKYVIADPQTAPLFQKMETTMEDFFSNVEFKPQEGGFLISGERYVMYRASSMSISLRNELEKVLGSGAEQAIYRFGKACGTSDAKYFINKLDLTDLMEKLAAGPIHFAFGGYAVVKFLPETQPSQDENCVLVYDHPNSYEASAYVHANMKMNKPVCQLNAGYSSGWVSEAFGQYLDAKEIACRAKGDDFCRFVMAPTKRLHERVKEIKEKYNIS